MRTPLCISAWLLASAVFAQNNARTIIVGDVADHATNEPLAYATIGVKGHIEQTISNSEGKFQLSVPVGYQSDTLFVTYVGYNHFEKPISRLASVEHILMTEMATLLDEVRVVNHKLDLREFDRGMKVIGGNLYAMSSEVTNLHYDTFLNWLEDYNKSDLRKKCEFNLHGYNKAGKDFFTRYHRI